MFLRKRLFALAFVLVLAPLAARAVPFAQDESDLKPDPAAHYGVLPNGVRYVIVPNKEPKNRASLRLVVQAGSLNEDEDQRGLAHFLEHMAFNGSTHYAPGTLVELLQRLGMGFGADTNASTSFDRTVYQLELPDTTQATLAQGIQIFADYGGGLLLNQDKVDKERGIILSEKRNRDNVEYRSFEAQFKFLLDGAKLPERMPIGLTPIIQTSQRDRFVRFYDTWYRPELLTVIVVGDFTEVAPIEKLITDDFSGIKGRLPARPAPDLGHVPQFDGVRALYHHESEAPETSVAITVIQPYSREIDNAVNRLKYLPRTIANAIINRRLQILAQKDGAPFIRGEASADEEFNFFHEASIEVAAKADMWKPALALAEQELRKALTYGFQPSEVKEAEADFFNDLEQAAKSAATRRSNEVASELVDTIVDQNVFTNAEQDLALYGGALRGVNADTCLNGLRAAWAGNARSVIISGNAVIDGDADETILASYEDSNQEKVSPPAKENELAWAYTDFGKPGRVVSKRTIDDLGITEVAFANGVLVNLKHTDFEANRIHVKLRVGSGTLSQPKDQPGLGVYTQLTFTAGGLGKHSADDLARILAGRTVGVDLRTDVDAFAFGGTTNRDDFLLQMQLFAATLIDPGYRPEAQRVAAKEIESAYLSFEHTSNGPLSLEVPKILAGGDPRFGLPPKEVMLARTQEEEKAWAGPQLSGGPLEVAIVGDIDIDACIDAVAKTLGALPARAPRSSNEALRHLNLPIPPVAKTYTIASEIPKGDVAVYWPTTDAFDVHVGRRLALLAEILSDRLRVKIREQMGGDYSPYARSDASDIFKDYGYISENLNPEPSKAGTIALAAAAVADDLAKNGASEDELSRAKNPLLTSLRESARTNSYWLNVLSRAQEKPEVLDWSRTRETDFNAITLKDVNELAAKYLNEGRESKFTVLPAIQPKP